MTPLTEHQLLVFWVQLAVLVATARGLGGLLRRFGQPAVVGELAAGLVLGPSLLGRVAPDVYGWLFPDDPVQSGLLLAVAWIGVALLLVITGFETDLDLLRQLGRQAAWVSTGSLVVPLALGFLAGWLMPPVFVGEAGTRLTFAMFAGIALSISALPVIAKILMEMNLMRRDIGQVTVAAGMANDLVGYLLLGGVAGIVTAGGLDARQLGLTTALMVVFVWLVFTVGQRATDRALRAARTSEAGQLGSFTVVLLVTLAAAGVAQAIGMEAVLGTLLAGVVLGRSRYLRPETAHTLETVTNAFLAPVFFATAGLFVDLGLLADPEVAAWAGLVLLAAAVSKLVGSYLGARLGGMRALEGLAIGVGLNARGALQVVMATVGLGLGVLNSSSYTVVMLTAIVTSMMAPPLLRVVLRRFEISPEEMARLDREAMLERSVIASARTALLPTRGGENSLLAGRLLDLSLQPDTTVAVFTVAEERSAGPNSVDAAGELQDWLPERTVERVRRQASDPAAAVCQEAKLGYGLVALGMTESPGSYAPSAALQRMLVDCPVPVLLVRHGINFDTRAEPLTFRRVLVPAIGTRAGTAAQEIAYTLAARTRAAVSVLHVVTRPDRPPAGFSVEGQLVARGSVAGMLGEAKYLAEQFGCEVSTLSRVGSQAGSELVTAAGDVGADLIVLGARVRSHEGEPFLGHGVEYVLEHASQTVMALILPSGERE